MRVELRIISGARAGARSTFDKSVIAIGRHPLNDLRLDALKDLDVSGHHAEIRIVGGTATLRDVGSSNGTDVNGQQLVGERALFDGDLIALGGASGASLEFRVLPDAVADAPADALANAPGTRVSGAGGGSAPAATPAGSVMPGRSTTARIAEAVEVHAGRMRRVLYYLGAGVLVVFLALAWMSRTNASADRATIEQLLQQLQDQNAAIAQLQGATAAPGLTDEVGRIRTGRDSVLVALRAGGNTQTITGRIAELSQRQNAAHEVSKVDYEKIGEQNTRAVAFIVVQHGDAVEGATGFGVTRDGLIVTNRHVAENTNGAAPKFAVQFHGTQKWLPARLLKVSSTDDLAFLKVDAPGAYPTVVGISSSGGVRAGAPIAIVGYPLGSGTAGMGGSIDTLTARATLTAGIVSKSVPDILQVDAYVAHGSSGSPVFNQRGLVVGVVYGGPTEAAGRIVYSVPSDRLIAQLPGEAAGAVRP